ncbi:hypothetical protein [Hymenobacter sp. B81]|uniref:hypothetical protein n=1 Tax=Hymenobacter sp. B81 TaxID=3344878 RepID=UPI0037DC2FC3
MPLLQLVAATSLWADRSTVDMLRQEAGNGTARWFLNVRRTRVKSEVGLFVDGVYLDDNSKANWAIKTAIGYPGKFKKFHACHIYDAHNEAYDPLYFCSIPNLVLIPSAIHSLADHSSECKQLLKYRAYWLYGFYKGTIPIKPSYYDDLKWHPYIGNVERAAKSIEKRCSTLQPKLLLT